MRQLLDFIYFIIPLLISAFLMIWGAIELMAWITPPNAWWHWILLFFSFVFIFAGGFFAIFLLARLYWETSDTLKKIKKN